MRFLLLLALLLLPSLAVAESARLAAVVNDEAITQTDLNDRVAMVFLSSGLPQDVESRKRITARVLDSLIDEHLQMQEARRYGIEIDPADIDKALGNIAKQNNMTADQLTSFMQSRGVPKQTMVDQVKASLAWMRLAQRVLRPQVEVGDDEVKAALERIHVNEGKPEYAISEIFLAVNSPAEEDRVRELANKLVDRMRQGARFGVVAQQFSQGIGAINGGDLGWIQPGQLSGEMDRAVRTLAVGQISLPIRMPDGFHILGKREERLITATDPATTEVHLRQASLKLAGHAPPQAEAEIKRFVENMQNCQALARPESFPEWSQVLYVCERNSSGTNHDALVNAIGIEKLELQAQRLLRDLRRSASIDMRVET
ncbi:MAG: peptidylprolyl isomerase [Proteobacteria bacterium]|nr:peptidylprolyl isomerase [Pseudomonadota bacterium]